MTGETNRPDRRINRTRRLLRDALMSLILERGYNAITIEDITERADLGRTTFYLHYKDKEELLVESLRSIAEDLRIQVEQVANQNLGDGRFRPNPVAIAFRHAEEHRDLYRIILHAEGSSRASSRMRDIIYDAALNFFSKYMKGILTNDTELPVDVVAGYFSSALMGFITWWIEKDLPYDGDQAADLFMELFFGGGRKILHLPGDLNDV